MAKIITQIPSISGVGIHNDLSGLNEGDYQHLTQDEKNNLEFISNKQNSLIPDGFGVKYPTVDATILGDTQTLNAANIYTDSKIVSLYKFKGNVANFASLPTSGRIIGDVWNALDTDINWAWTGTVWDSLGGTIDISGKLDKGTYTGDAQDLKDEIDNIYQPNVLISSVPPSRVINTFTYPANQYEALINKTIRTNPSFFVTTISAATTDYKRVDLIYFKSDNTIDKIIGVESLTVAVRPDIPINAVAISFINVFGNVISDPIPVTDEISFQDIFGAERFKGNYVRFDGVSFNPAQKLIAIDPLVPLAAFLDIVNGNDTTAAIENSKKPFRTIEKLLSSLPATTGETYNIYITGGTIPILRKIVNRNLRFIAYRSTILDFTNCMEADGVTHAAFVIDTTSVTPYSWTFENKNISIISNYVGNKEFNGSTYLSLLGNINLLEWRSRTTQSFQASFNIRASSIIEFIEVRDTAQNTIVLGAGGVCSIIVNTYTCTNGRRLSGGIGTGSFMEVRNITGANNTVIVGNTALASLRIGNVLTTLILTTECTKVEFYGAINSTCQVDLSGCTRISGTLDTVLYAKGENINSKRTFENFNGKIDNFQIIKNGSLEFINSYVSVKTSLLRKYIGTVVASQVTDNNLLFLKGTNSFIQELTVNELITFEGATLTDKQVIIHDYGSATTNAKSFGTFTQYIKEASTFKEKEKEIVIRSKKDLVGRVLDSMTTYVIDGTITLLTGEYIEIPAGGLTINGYGFTPSSIVKNVTGQSIFTSAAGGSGDFVSINVSYYPGTGSVFNIIDINGSHAIELDKVNFQGVTGSSLGIINGYRQFTGTTCGLYNLSDGLILEGNWSGFKLTNSNVIGFGSTGTLFKKGSSTLFSNRFYIDLNLQIATGSKLCDFADTNFTNNKSLQVVNCYLKVNGIVADDVTSPTVTTITGNVFPNITPYSNKAYFLNNIGLLNSRYIVPTAINGNEAVNLGQLVDNILTSSATLSLANTSRVMYYTYTGATTSIWTLPAILGNTKMRFILINTGTNTVTVNSNTGSNEIWDSGTLSNTTPLTPGSSMELFNNGVSYIIL